jgi:hypothetical protein
MRPVSNTCAARCGRREERSCRARQDVRAFLDYGARRPSPPRRKEVRHQRAGMFAMQYRTRTPHQEAFHLSPTVRYSVIAIDVMRPKNSALNRQSWPVSVRHNKFALVFSIRFAWMFWRKHWLAPSGRLIGARPLFTESANGAISERQIDARNLNKKARNSKRGRKRCNTKQTSPKQESPRP